MKLLLLTLLLTISEQVSFAQCNNTTTNKPLSIANSGIKDATVFVINPKPTCPDVDTVNPNTNILAPITPNGSTNLPTLNLPTLNLPIGSYDLCIEFSDKNKTVNGFTINQYKHQILKRVFVKNIDENQLVTILPGKQDHKIRLFNGPCNFKQIAGNWSGSSTPTTTNNPNCTTSNINLIINDLGKVTGTANTSTNQILNIKEKVNTIGKFQKAPITLSNKNIVKLTGNIDIVKDIGAGKYLEIDSSCEGTFSITKQ